MQHHRQLARHRHQRPTLGPLLAYHRPRAFTIGELHWSVETEVNNSLQSASAGVRGPEVREDCWVEVRSGRSSAAAPVIEVSTGAGAGEEDAVRQVARQTLAALDAGGISIRIEDSGALPFTIMARVEAAVRRLRGPGASVALPPSRPETHYRSSRDRIRRTRLFVPGSTPKFFAKAGLCDPDVVILDLEDGVVPQEKDSARLIVRNALLAVDFRGAERTVRINPLPLGLEDIRAVAPHGVHVLLLSKTEDPAEVVEVDRAVRQALKDHGQEAEVYLVPSIETARAAFRALEIAEASPRVVGLSLGLEDYVNDIGAEHTPERRESLWFTGQVLNASRAAGVQPLGSVYTDIQDLEGLARYAEDFRKLGFEGLACIHPSQVPVINEAFTPTPQDVARAQRIVDAFEEAAATGAGAISVDGKLLDLPVVELARGVLRRASACGIGVRAEA